MKKILLIISAMLIMGCGSDSSSREYQVGDLCLVTHYCYVYQGDVSIDSPPAERITVLQPDDIGVIEEISGQYIKVRKIDEENGYWIAEFFTVPY